MTQKRNRLINLNSDDLFSVRDKVVIVTGAARGNGRAIAEGFLKAGAMVYFIDILKKELKVLEKEINDRRARYIAANVTDFKLMNDIVEKIYREKRRIDVLVNNAGITLPAPAERYSEDKWERTYCLNLKAPFRLSQIVVKYMKRRGGVIINITSLAAELGFPNNPAYHAAKGGLKQLGRALAAEWAKYNIRVNNLVPGYIRTEMTKRSWGNKKLREAIKARTMLGRWGEPEDLIGAAIFLASGASGYITGHNIYVDGGWLAK